MFLPASIVIAAGSTVRYDYVQSTEPLGMEALLAQYVARLQAENAQRVADGEDPLIPLDLDIAGAGSGYPFVVRVLLMSTSASLDFNPSIRFWAASDAESLSDYQEAAIASLKAALPTGMAGVAVGMAGASQGTRFMALMGAHPPPD
jgi:hypothetical protein